MQTHESWRDEVGWVLAVVGSGLLALTIIDLFFAIVVGTYVPAWGLFLLSAVLLGLGIGLHLARPARPTTESTAPTTADDAPVPEAQSTPPQ